MKRLYRHAAVETAEGGFAITLDGKIVRTPGKAALVLGSRALAEAIAAEWQAQGDRVDPESMPMTRLASTAIDLVAPRHAEVVAMIAKYAATDLVCYRADDPPELVARQHRAWQPLVDWVRERHGARLEVASGIMPCPQPEASLAALTACVAARDPWQLAALNLATAACGSLVVALALAEGQLDAEQAFSVAELDASFEIERWGEDAEQTARRRALKDDIAMAARFLALLAA
ncbi:MAG TPA: ATP12 family protein [Stellaceae bacterium]|nr:ATP12 family protein [Stellaceae bacterium]